MVTNQRIECFFDCSSPWTYLAFETLQPLVSRQDVQLIWRPILVGGLFNTINPSVYENRANPVPAKARYYQKDLQDWARFVGVNIGMPPVFPVNSVKAMRGALVAEEMGQLMPYVRGVFTAYWGELQDISQEDVLLDVVAKADMEPKEFLEKISQATYKERLRANTEECGQRGGFGSPTLFLNGDDMYFGNDRIALLIAALDGQ